MHGGYSSAGPAPDSLWCHMGTTIGSQRQGGCYIHPYYETYNAQKAGKWNKVLKTQLSQEITPNLPAPILPKQCSIVMRVYSVAVRPTCPNLLRKSVCACAGVGTKEASRRQRFNVELMVKVKGQPNPRSPHDQPALALL